MRAVPTAGSRRETESVKTLVGRLPDFLVIGAMKAGTTSLYHYLRAHPQVFMPAIKAPEFFVAESNWGRGVEWYAKLFAPAGTQVAAVGEASNAYAKYPFHLGVPERMAGCIPDVRLIYTVRDPVQRIRSHYRTRAREGSEKAPIERAIFENPIYLDYSRYAMQLDRFLEHFPREQLQVITADDLRGDRLSTMREVYGFIGVDPDVVPADLDREFYQTDDQPSRSLVPLRIRKALKKHVPAAKRAKELENNLFRMLKRRRPSPPTEEVHAAISDDVRARIGELLADDVQRLRAFLRPTFDGWGIA